jgi:hypothetical protein
VCGVNNQVAYGPCTTRVEFFIGQDAFFICHLDGLPDKVFAVCGLLWSVLLTNVFELSILVQHSLSRLFLFGICIFRNIETFQWISMLHTDVP